MAHEIENLTSTRAGASFVTARQHAWHGLGTVLPETFDAAAAMQHAHLGGWNVRKLALQTAPELTEAGVTGPIALPDRFATVRTNPVTGQVEPLGVVGAEYQPIQNEDHAEVLNAIVDESGAHFETAGSLKGGRQVFLTMKMPRTMLIGGVDPIDLYLIALNSHDGSTAFRLLVSPVRVVCANTQAAALRRHKASFSIRHTSGARGRIEHARQALGLTFAYADAFAAEAEQMICAQIEADEFAAIIAKAWPESSGTGRQAQRNADRRAREIRALQLTSPTLPDEFRATRWGAYQALTEYIDHVMPTRGRTDEVRARAERAATGTGPGIKSAAFDLLRV